MNDNNIIHIIIHIVITFYDNINLVFTITNTTWFCFNLLISLHLN